MIRKPRRTSSSTQSAGSAASRTPPPRRQRRLASGGEDQVVEAEDGAQAEQEEPGEPALDLAVGRERVDEPEERDAPGRDAVQPAEQPGPRLPQEQKERHQTDQAEGSQGRTEKQSPHNAPPASAARRAMASGLEPRASAGVRSRAAASGSTP